MVSLHTKVCVKFWSPPVLQPAYGVIVQEWKRMAPRVHQPMVLARSALLSSQ